MHGVIHSEVIRQAVTSPIITYGGNIFNMPWSRFEEIIGCSVGPAEAWLYIINNKPLDEGWRFSITRWAQLLLSLIVLYLSSCDDSGKADFFFFFLLILHSTPSSQSASEIQSYCAFQHIQQIVQDSLTHKGEKCRAPAMPWLSPVLFAQGCTLR